MARPIQRSQSAREVFERAYDLFEAGQHTKARDAYELATRLGSPHAQINLANLYDDGTFGRRNRRRAINLYRRALAHGFPEAAYNMAQLYRREKNERWYHYWLRRAAKMGDNDAKAELRSTQPRRKSKRG